jgi:hypothetical protein
VRTVSQAAAKPKTIRPELLVRMQGAFSVRKVAHAESTNIRIDCRSFKLKLFVRMSYVCMWSVWIFVGQDAVRNVVRGVGRVFHYLPSTIQSKKCNLRNGSIPTLFVHICRRDIDTPYLNSRS